MENQELRTKIDGLKGTLVQVMDEGFDIAKSFLSLRLEEYLNRTTGSTSTGSARSSRAIEGEEEVESDSMPTPRSAVRKASNKSGRSRRS